MKKIFTLIVIILITGFSVKSQNIYHPWIIGVSTNYTDFNVIDKPLGDQFTDADWMGKTLPTQLRIGRMLNSSFNLTAILSTVTLEVDKLNNIPLEKQISDDFFWKGGVQLEYKFANGYLLKETSWFDPYIYTGLSASNIDQISYMSFPMGVGLNIWPTNYLGVNFQGSYDYVFDFNDYMHYSVGLVVRFGKMRDRDKDQIPDKYDACPDVFGVEAFQGCPDTDGDGVVDSLDMCPNDFGPVSLAGCPDTDKDGIPDIKDNCPLEAGTAKNNGCPDTDGDGVLDKDDNCPMEAGSPATFGCPDSDGDGIPDNLDECPKEAGLKENNGCPAEKVESAVVLPVVTDNTIDLKDVKIAFDLNSAKIHKGSIGKLEEIHKMMTKYPETKYSIFGYADNTGPSDFNLKLSNMRAEAVKKYFTDKGVAESRLEVKGFGDKNPAATNNTPEGRAINRRVEILKK